MSQKKPLINSCWILLLLLGLGATAPAVVAADESKRYLLLISIDGFRWDYLDKYSTPAMHELASRGVRADALLPVFPTLTFPNHYSIATGLYPQNHGLVANEFPDPESGGWYNYKKKETAQDGRWYGGEPIWVAAAKAGMPTAAFYFVGSEADIQGIRPDRWNAYNKLITGDLRTAQVLQWLAEPEETRPQVITLYFDDVDDHSHWTGVGSAAMVAAITRVDGYIQQLLDGLDTLPYKDQVSIVLVSDHGQGDYSNPGPPFILDGRYSLDGITPVDGGSYLFLHFDEPDPQRVARLQQAINQDWDCGQAYTPEDAPTAWQVGDNPRFPELILTPDPGCAVLSHPDKASKINHGDHGWAPEDPDMHGIFIAMGPGIPAGLRIPPLRAVDIYPLFLRQLDLPSSHKTDSDPDLWPNLLDSAKPGSP
jgi:predicted AlkP superfamily pyrophosphatase or phosphodiesterase